MRKTTAIALLSAKVCQSGLEIIEKMIDGRVVRVLYFDLLEFGDPFLLDIFEKMIGEGDQSERFVVKFNFKSIWSVSHKTFDLVVMI